MRYYVYFELARDRIRESAFLNEPIFEGAQLKYTWRELERVRDQYDFRAIHDDLAFLGARGKRLFVQLQDVTFTPADSCVPKYLRDDPAFHGGADRQYDIPGDNEAKATVAGWVARRWDPAVRAPFASLLTALGREFDGRIAGINLPETAVEFGESGRLFPSGFTPAIYRDGIVANMAALKRAFPRSITLQYANFMPGEWLPWTDRGYLRNVYEHARALGVGVAGPDLLPWKKGQMSHSYPLIAASHGKVPTGIAVQEGNGAWNNPKTGKRITPREQVAFARDYLKVDYMFWFPGEPYYTRDVVPYLRATR